MQNNDMQTKDLLEVPDPWPKVSMKKLRANLIPEYLAELARRGVYYESNVLN